MSPKDLHTNDEHFLARFFEPESVAIVGASNNPMRVNYHLLANLIKLGFQGRIYPVHPSEKEILGLKAYPSVKHIPETVDLAVIGVSSAVTPEVLKECVEKGIKRVTLIAGGFSEAGEQMVRYYGYYSNVSRGKRKKKDQDGLVPCILQSKESSKGFRKNWARFTRLWRADTKNL